jgi:hypothetical protein
MPASGFHFLILALRHAGLASSSPRRHRAEARTRPSCNRPRLCSGSSGGRGRPGCSRRAPRTPGRGRAPLVPLGPVSRVLPPGWKVRAARALRPNGRGRLRRSIANRAWSPAIAKGTPRASLARDTHASRFVALSHYVLGRCVRGQPGTWGSGALYAAASRSLTGHTEQTVTRPGPTGARACGVTVQASVAAASELIERAPATVHTQNDQDPDRHGLAIRRPDQPGPPHHEQRERLLSREQSGSH